MLGGLARWLRAADYDSLFAEGGWSDRELVELCAREDRVLLTKDRQLALSARDTIPLLLLGSRGMDGNARELREVLGVDWQHAPFTRCLVDNALLTAADPHDAERVPLSSRSREPVAQMPDLQSTLLAQRPRRPHAAAPHIVAGPPHERRRMPDERQHRV